MAEDMHYSFDYEWFLRLTKNVKAAHMHRTWGALRLHGETKTRLNAQRFREENERIFGGYTNPFWKKPYFMARRMVLMLAYGQVFYVLRGIVQRTLGHYREYC